jgi:hypothetical protein
MVTRPIVSVQYSQYLLRVDRRSTEMKFTTEQRVFIVESFASKKNLQRMYP